MIVSVARSRHPTSIFGSTVSWSVTNSFSRSVMTLLRHKVPGPARIPTHHKLQNKHTTFGKSISVHMFPYSDSDSALGKFSIPQTELWYCTHVHIVQLSQTTTGSRGRAHSAMQLMHRTHRHNPPLMPHAALARLLCRIPADCCIIER